MWAQKMMSALVRHQDGASSFDRLVLTVIGTTNQYAASLQATGTYNALTAFLPLGIVMKPLHWLHYLHTSVNIGPRLLIGLT